jgi:nucleoside-diphosphate-sugar epimerase
MKLVAIGLGYCARHFVRTRGLAAATLGTTREPAQAARLSSEGFRVAYCDGAACDPAIPAALEACEAMLVSAAPQASGDPILQAFADNLRSAPRLERLIYLSSVGVYGDRAGDWVNEDAELRPANERSRERVEAEAAWHRFGEVNGKRVFVLRLAGIYGPGRNALTAVAEGKARRIVKPGQVFNRIHVEDVARAVEAALYSPRAGGVWNVSDDEPSAPGEPIAFAASLLGLPPPPEIAFEDAELSPMARSFWGESKRVSNARLKRELGVALAYPTFREGLQALRQSGEGRRRSLDEEEGQARP